jgi:hypothetical protein
MPRPIMTHGWAVVSYSPNMSSWEDHEEMIDDQYLMESIEEDQKVAEGDADDDDENESEEEE